MVVWGALVAGTGAVCIYCEYVGGKVERQLLRTAGRRSSKSSRPSYARGGATPLQREAERPWVVDDAEVVVVVTCGTAGAEPVGVVPWLWLPAAKPLCPLACDRLWCWAR